MNQADPLIKLQEDEKNKILISSKHSQVRMGLFPSPKIASEKEQEEHQEGMRLSDERINDIKEVFTDKQLIILNDLANLDVSQEVDFKQELQVEIKQQVSLLIFFNISQVTKARELEVSIIYIEEEKPVRQGTKKFYCNFIKIIIEGCQISVFKSDMVGRVLWDLFTMLFIFHEIILLPVDLSFQIESDYLVIMNYVTTTVFGLDIIINFNTAYQFKGQYVEDRKMIALQYFKLWFWIDFGSSFPFDMIIDSFSVSDNSENNNDSEALKIGMRILRVLKFFRFIKVMKLLRVLKLKKMFGKLEDYIDLSAAMVSLYEILKLTMLMLFVAHWLACIWHLIADYEEKGGTHSWLSEQDLTDKSWDTKYIASVYWATATMTQIGQIPIFFRTVGYGDIVPFTSIEKIFGIIVMLLACCIFAYVRIDQISIFRL